MSHPLFWPAVTFFYPVGNTSAVCLTGNLTPESKADVLLLACGDPRHILYTVYANEDNPLTSLRSFDITCCDVDVAILARSALLFTLLADEGALDKLDNLWNLFYHMFVDKTSLSVLFDQCRKLVALAESTETWRVGPYGHFLTVCNAATLAELRRVWSTYLDTATLSSKKAKRFEQRFIDGMKEMSRSMGSGRTTTAARSAGPLASHAHEVVSRQFRSYWTFGTTDSTQGYGKGQKRHLTVNPTFAFSVDGDKFAVHYGTDPLSGFHLADAFASGKFTRPHEHISPHDMVRVAKDQFSRWCMSVCKRLRNSNPSSPTFVIRMFAGDALMFCQALRYCEVTRSSVTPYNVAAWLLSIITLDDHCYGRSAVSPAPLSFNVIDTSNILDHAGLVNVLVVTAPLLRKTHSATLYTEALVRIGGNPSQAVLEHICGDLPTMALLLGIIPSTFVSQFTTRSNVHETLAMGEGAKQYHERLAWKAIGFGGPRTQHGPDDAPTPQRLCFAPQDLAVFLFGVYVHMFSDEDVESRFQLLSLSHEHMVQTLRRSSVLHYNRRSFALLVHFIKTRVQTDWWQTMDLFEDLVLADHQLMTGQHAYQELCCQLYLLDVYTTKWLSDRDHLPYEEGSRLFHDWTRSQIPLVVTLVLVVPREAIARLEPDFMDIGTPALQCDMHDGPRQNWFAAISATLGSLHVSGTGEHKTAVVIQGGTDANASVGAGAGVGGTQPLWRTGAPLIVTFSVPTSSVMDFAQNPRSTVGLALRPTVVVTAKFVDKLGFNLTVFRTQLTDAKRVFVLARPPVMGTSAVTDAGRDAGATTANHWQENVRGTSYSEQVTSAPGVMLHRASADVQVQMDNVYSTVQSFTVRISIADPSAREVLADVRTIPTVTSRLGSMRSLDACVRVGKHTFTTRFPLPVDVGRARLRVARRSSYVEVIAPLAPFDVRPERDLSSRFAPLSLNPNDDGAPTLWNIHYINIDRCPTFKFPKNLSTPHWFDLHVDLMFSELERERTLRSNTKSPVIGSNGLTPFPDALLRVKRTLHLILRGAASTKPNGAFPEHVFALCDTSRRGFSYLHIIVVRVCLDVGSHTVVADAFVAPTTPVLLPALYLALHDACENQQDTAIQCIDTDADETAAWFHLLPQLTERCRTWLHRTNCDYRASKHQAQNPGGQTLGTWDSQSLLCSCGAGVGTGILRKPFEGVAPYFTRAAFSPLFSVPYLKEVDVLADAPFTRTRMGVPGKDVTPRVPLHDSNVDVDKTDRVGAGYRCRWCGEEGDRVCSRCKRARYCSKACQRADWKGHKKDCGNVIEGVCGSDLGVCG